MLRGNVGLLFTNEEPAEVQQWFEKYHSMEYARAGFVVQEPISLKEGKIKMYRDISNLKNFSEVFTGLCLGPLEQFSHSIEPHLRSLGLPTELKKGKVILSHDHQVCQSDDVLTPEQARIIVRYLIIVWIVKNEFLII